MEDKEILTKAFEKVFKNGYQGPKKYIRHHAIDDLEGVVEWLSFDYEQWCTLLGGVSVETFIFSHDFAKAFWGWDLVTKWVHGDNCCANGGSKSCVRMVGTLGEATCYEDDNVSWQYHLQRIVLEENPIKYLEQFLDKETND